MNKPNYQTSMQFTAEDFLLKEQLRKAGVSIIDTWRKGAQVKIREVLKKKT